MTFDFVYIHSFWDDGTTRLMLIVPTSIGGSERKPALMEIKIPLVPTSVYLETWLTDVIEYCFIDMSPVRNVLH